MNFERGQDPVKILDLGIEKQILKYLKAHTYIELRNYSIRDAIFKKIESELGIKLENICDITDRFSIIKVRVKNSDIVVLYEFDTPF